MMHVARVPNKRPNVHFMLVVLFVMSHLIKVLVRWLAGSSNSWGRATRKHWTQPCAVRVDVPCSMDVVCIYDAADTKISSPLSTGTDTEVEQDAHGKTETKIADCVQSNDAVCPLAKTANWGGDGADSRLDFRFYGDRQSTRSPPLRKRWPNPHSTKPYV